MTLLRTASIVALTSLALGGCGGFSGFNFGGSASQSPNQDFAPGAPTAPPVAMAGRWLLAQPGRGQCNMTLGAASPSAPDGTIAPEGGCPGKFFTSRKWTYDQSGLTMRDHNGQPLAQLSGGGGRFEGKASSGEPVTLSR